MEQKPVEFTNKQILAISAFFVMTVSILLQMPVAGILILVLGRLIIFPRLPEEVEQEEEKDEKEEEETNGTS